MADVRYQIILNGRALCVAGVDGLGGVLNATLTWVKRERRPGDDVLDDDEVPQEGKILESHYLNVGGVDPLANDHVRWCEEPLKPGDEIMIRILGPGKADDPQERYKFP